MTTYYSWGGSSVLAEYTESTGNGATFKIAKSYFYAGSRLLSTQTWNGSTETTEFHHPDRLGTKLVTNNAANTSYEQSTLPFGTALSAESSGFSNQVFTSYDRSAGTGLDYAVNRNYSSRQGRFTSVDPAQDGWNLFAYANNDPINSIDPTGLNAESPGNEMSYYIDGILTTRRHALSMLSGGGGVIGPASAIAYSYSEGQFQQFRAYANGETAWMNLVGITITAKVALWHDGIAGGRGWFAGSAGWSGIFSYGDTGGNRAAPPSTPSEPFGPRHPPKEPGTKEPEAPKQPANKCRSGYGQFDLTVVGPTWVGGSTGTMMSGDQWYSYKGPTLGTPTVGISGMGGTSRVTEGRNYNLTLTTTPFIFSLSTAGTTYEQMQRNVSISIGGALSTPSFTGGYVDVSRINDRDPCK